MLQKGFILSDSFILHILHLLLPQHFWPFRFWRSVCDWNSKFGASNHTNGYKLAIHSMQNALRGEYGKVATNCIPMYLQITNNLPWWNHQLTKDANLPKTNIFSIVVSNSFGPTLPSIVLAPGQLVRNSFCFKGLLERSCMCCLCESSLFDVRSSPAFATSGHGMVPWQGSVSSRIRWHWLTLTVITFQFLS